MAHARYAPVSEHLPLHVTATGTTVAVGALVNTTSATTITGGGASQAITPASMSNITVGMWLNIANGSGGAAENVQVTAVNQSAGTFTAVFANAHSGAYTIISLRGTFLGKLVVNQPGTGVTITLYNGHPSTSPAAGAPIAVLTGLAAGQVFTYDCLCNRGLFYTLAGTAGDYTITSLDQQI